MEHEYPRETMERLSLSEKRRLIVGLYRKNWNGGRRLPFMPAVVSPEGAELEKDPCAAPGSAELEKVEAEDGIIRSVRTGTGLIVIGRAELMTKELTGCMGVLVRGETKDGEPLAALFHMTPTSKLAWGNFRNEDDDKRWGSDVRDRMSKAIAEALAEAGGNLDKCSAVLMRTAGSPPNPGKYNGYAEDRESEKGADLAKRLSECGLRAKALQPLCMETATIYWNPEAPDEILAVGETRIPNPAGGVDEPPQGERSVISDVIALGE